METISIGTTQPAASVRADLEQEIKLLHGHGLAVKLLDSEQGTYSFVDCRFEDNPGSRVLRYYLANVITDLILNAVTRKLLLQIIQGGFAYFTPDERESIMAEALAALNLRGDVQGIPCRVYRRNQILAKVLRHLEHHDQLVLEGFVRFQLKDYYEELKAVVDGAVEEHMLQRDYEEFIRLLRYFVEIQPSRIDEVNVRVKGGGMFSLLDEEGQPIEHEQLRSVLTDAGPEEIDYEDLLLSALITISPARVILHVLEPLEVIDTIVQVFGERVVICPGCRVCRPE